MGALLAAFASLASGVVGAGAADAAAQRNYNIDLLNYFSREKERRQAIEAADKRDRETKLGSTDASGNHTYFKPGVGWVTDLAPEQQTLQDLYQNEELQQLQNDLSKKRQILNANVTRQGAESGRAEALMDAFMRVQRPDAGMVEGLMNDASVRGINEGFDGALNEAMRTAVRSGASNSGKVAAEIGKSKSKALVDAFLNNKINATGQADQQYDQERANIANLYNMFATRASAMPDVAYNPRNIEGLASAAQGANMSNNSQAGGALINAFAKQGGTLSMMEPNYGWANAIASGGNALGAAFDSLFADKKRDNAFDAYAQYAGVNPDMYKGSSGAW